MIMLIVTIIGNTIEALFKYLWYLYTNYTIELYIPTLLLHTHVFSGLHAVLYAETTVDTP